MNKSKVTLSEAAGAAVIYAAAVYLHFAYRLSGGSALGILFGAVNESIWEHVKIFSGAYVGYSILQLCWLRLPFRQYLTAKCIGLYFLMGSMIGFCIYTRFTGAPVYQADIISSLVIVILTQTLTFFLETGDNRLAEYFQPAVMLILLYYLMFFSFTIFPPKTDLFRDPVSGSCGIPADTAANL